MFRKILAIITGYIIFAASAVLLFQITGQKPHQTATTGFMVLTAIYGICFSVLSGWVLVLIARTNTLTINFILSFIIAAFALVSMLTSGGSHWTQWQSIILFAPSSILGGWFYLRHKRS